MQARLAQERMIKEAVAFAVLKLFNKIRVHIAKRRKRQRKHAAWLISRTVVRLVQKVARARWRKARMHYLSVLKRRFVSAWRKQSTTMAVSTRSKQEEGVHFVQCFRMRVLVRVWREAYADRKETVLSKHAMAVWQMVGMRRVYASWKKCLLQTEDGSVARKIRFVRQLHLALALEPYHNSFRQQRHRALADAFLLRRLLLPAWLCLYEDLHLTRIAGDSQAYFTLSYHILLYYILLIHSYLTSFFTTIMSPHHYPLSSQS